MNLHERIGGLAGAALLAGCTATPVDPPMLDLNRDAPSRGPSILDEFDVKEPPTAWIDEPVATDCPACEGHAEEARTFQEAAMMNLPSPGTQGWNRIGAGERKLKWRSIWSSWRLYQAALERMRTCEREQCPKIVEESAQPDSFFGKSVFARARALGIPASSFDLRLAGGQLEDPQIGFGTIIDGADEDFHEESETHLNRYQFSAFYRRAFDRWMDDLLDQAAESGGESRRSREIGRQLYVGYDFQRADGDSSAEEPIGGRAVAITDFGLDSPDAQTSGTDPGTGVAAGATGLRTELDTDWRDHRFAAGVQSVFAVDDRSYVELSGGPFYRRTEAKYSGRAQSLTFDDVFSEIDQDVDTDTIGIEFNVTWNRVLSARSMVSIDEETPSRESRTRLRTGSWSMFGGGRIEAYYYEADLDSFQRIVAVPAGITNFTSRIEDDDERFGIGLNVEAGVGYRRSDRLKFDFSIRGGWRSDVPEVDNPASPAGEPTHLDHTDQFFWDAGGRIRFDF